MSLQSRDTLNKIDTYTYHGDSHEEPVEVFLIGVEADGIGSDNRFNPNGFDKHHISTWLKKQYYFVGGTVYAQVPRRTTNFPIEAKEQLQFGDSFADRIRHNSDTDQIEIIYPLQNGNILVLTWNVSTDYWTMDVDENISASDEWETVWEAP